MIDNTRRYRVGATNTAGIFVIEPGDKSAPPQSRRVVQ